MTDGISVASKAEQAWERAWQHLYRPATRLFYDYVTSHDPAQELDHLPTPDEVSRQEPNGCGWGTGMEDSVISGGLVLAMLCDRFAVTGEKSLESIAADVFSGMEQNALVHGVPGFVARSRCLADGVSVYNTSSRDQFTHFIHGGWRLYHSPLADEGIRERIKARFVEVAEFVERTVTPENNWTMLRLDGTPSPVDVHKMWHVHPHEAARLPMIYLAAWQLSGDGHWLEACRRYVAQAAEESTRLRSRRYLCYALLQMQSSLELILAVGCGDPAAEEKIRAAMELAADLSLCNLVEAAGSADETDFAVCYADWRTRPRREMWGGYVIPLPKPEASQGMKVLREIGESALIRLMIPGRRLGELHRRVMREILLKVDFTQVCSNGMLALLAAYWRARRAGVDFEAE